MRRILAVVVLMLMVGGPAVAGPSPEQPATTAITANQAHTAATAIVDLYLIPTLPGPARQSMEACRGGLKVWRCPTVVTASDTRCHFVAKVWRDRRNYFVEFKGLRCS